MNNNNKEAEQDSNLRHSILALFETDENWKAKEIVKKLGALRKTRTAVNRVLYKLEEEGILIKEPNTTPPVWRLASSSVPPAVSRSPQQHLSPHPPQAPRYVEEKKPQPLTLPLKVPSDILLFLPR